MTHLCVSKLAITGSDNGLSPGRRRAIIWTNALILLIRNWETKFSEILSEIRTSSFNKMRLKVSFAKWWPFLSRPHCAKNTPFRKLCYQNCNSLPWELSEKSLSGHFTADDVSETRHGRTSVTPLEWEWYMLDYWNRGNRQLFWYYVVKVSN